MKYPSQLVPFPTFHSERLLLREITHSDLVPMIEISGYKVENATEKEALALIDRLDTTRSTDEGITWGLELAGELIGTIGFYRGFQNNVGEIGYFTRADFRRNGYTEEAIRIIIDFAFETMGLASISAYTAPDNDPSISLLGKLKFARIGIAENKDVIFKLERFSNNS